MMQATILKSGTALLLAASVQIALAMPADLPMQQRHQGAVTFLSGGVGLDESSAIKGEMHNYPLVLEFAGKSSNGNVYLSDVSVQVSDMHGHTLLTTTARGPFLLATLPKGHYTVTARYNGQTERRDVAITPAAHLHELFLWPM